MSDLYIILYVPNAHSYNNDRVVVNTIIKNILWHDRDDGFDEY